MKLKIAVQAATPSASVEAARRFLWIANMSVPKTDSGLSNILHRCSTLAWALGLH
jgi:hypothetical protein